MVGMLPRLLGLVGALVALALVPTFANYAQAPKWAVLAIGLALLIAFTRLHPTRGHWLVALILTWAMISLAWTPIMMDGIQGMAMLLMVSAAFCLGAECETLEPVYKSIALALIPSAGLMLMAHLGKQLFGHLPFAVIYPESPAGLFGNQNWAAEAAMPVLVGLIAWDQTRLLFVGPAAIVIVLAECRSAITGLGAAMVMALWRQSRMLAASAIIAMLISGTFAFAWLKPSPQSLHERAMIWADSFDGLTFFGRGIGSYRGAVSQYGWRLDTIALNTEHAHNDALELLFELGPIGLVGFCLVVAMALGAPQSRERLVLVAILVDGILAFPLYEPVTALLVGLVAGRLCRTRDDVRRLMDRGGRDQSSGLPGRRAWQPAYR